MKRMGKGLVQVYTGDGKGKTTAAVGLALRMSGAGGRVLFVQFFKKQESSEIGLLRCLAPSVRIISLCREYPLFRKPTRAEGEKIRQRLARSLVRVGRLLDGDYDLVVLDEILIGLRDGLLEEKQMEKTCRGRAPGVEIVLTGRGATPGIVTMADLVTRMEMVKHPFDQGVGARKGIEY